MTVYYRTVIFIFIVDLLPCSVNTHLTNVIPPENHLYDAFETNEIPNINDLVKRYAYLFQIHRITTKDGYILELHRIPHGKTSTHTRRTPVLLLHGLFQNSASFLVHGEENSPGFIFANAGYDVWLYNSRGTRYSIDHESLSSETDYAYWKFGFDEMGNYDLPAVVDYILSTSNADQLYIVGFSIGGAASSVFLADNPSFNDKALFIVAEDLNAMPFSEVLYDACRVACTGPMFQMCQDFVAYIDDDDNTTMIDNSELVIGKLATAASHVTIKLMRHLLQMVVREEFSKFDYGADVNLQKYGQEIPPAYRIENITTHVRIFCALGDSFVFCRDLQNISNRFPNYTNVTAVQLESHKEFSGGEMAKLYVYDAILDEMETQELNSESEFTKHTQSFSSNAKNAFHEFRSVITVSCTVGVLVFLCTTLAFLLKRSYKKINAVERQVLVTNSKPQSTFN